MNVKKGSGKQQGNIKVIQTKKAIAKLSQVSREAKTTMKFVGIELISELIKNFKNDSIKINIIKN
jgi:hypothetical protein